MLSLVKLCKWPLRIKTTVWDSFILVMFTILSGPEVKCPPNTVKGQVNICVAGNGAQTSTDKENASLSDRVG